MGFDPRKFRTDERLAVYGSLAPGRKNAHILAALGGSWIDGTVRGALRTSGWGAALGFPGIELDRNAGPVPVALLCSRDLPGMWERLDAFEGADYVRTVVDVETARGTVPANIYSLAPAGDSDV
jgi:gamma-glutamylcyclotransferase (GGCT)/AIG2-like uncharacterized protein YtfP